MPVADATPGTADVVATAVAGTAAPWLWFWMIRAEVTLWSIEPRNDCLKPLISTEQEHDQADADHERGRRDGGAARVAGRCSRARSVPTPG